MSSDELVVVEYHTSDEFTFTGITARTNYYSFSGIPVCFFDGYQNVGGGGSSTYNQYLNMINSHLNNPSPLTIDGLMFYPNDGNNTSATAAAAINIETAIAETGVKVWAILIEHPAQAANGNSYNYVARALSSYDLTIWQPGQTENVSFNFNLNPTWVVDNLALVMYVQNHASKHIHQARMTELGGTMTVTDMQINEVSGDGDDRFEPGESGEVVLNLENVSFPMGFHNVTLELTTDSPSLIIEPAVINLGDLAIDSAVNNYGTPIVFTVPEGSEPHHANFTLSIMADELSLTREFDFIIGRPLMIVDHDGGAELETFFTDAVSEHGLFYEMRTADQVPDEMYFTDYPTVIWFTGDEGNGLSEDAITALSVYLEAGNNLILTGQDIAETLPAGGTFLEDYLGVSYERNTVAGVLGVLGMNDDPFFGDLQVVVAMGSGGAQNQTSMDVLNVIDGSGAIPIMEYAGDPGAVGAVRYSDPTAGYKAVYFGFGLEAVYGVMTYASLPQVLETCFEFFDAATAVEDDPVVSAYQTQLRQNFPNPFNPTTMIPFSLQANDAVSLDVYNVSGQKVRTLVNSVLAAGSHSVVWDGRGDNGLSVGSGIYFYRLTTSDRQLTERMILMK